MFHGLLFDKCSGCQEGIKTRELEGIEDGEDVAVTVHETILSHFQIPVLVKLKPPKVKTTSISYDVTLDGYTGSGVSPVYQIEEDVYAFICLKPVLDSSKAAAVLPVDTADLVFLPGLTPLARYKEIKEKVFNLLQ